MTMQPHILVGVDGSDDGLRAVHYAIEEATVRDCAMRLVHVVDDAVMAGVWGVVYDPTILREVGQSAIDTAINHCVSHGFPRERIFRS